VDSSNISEKAWAVQSGVGYYGKNGIIQTSAGSFVFLGILLIDKEVNMYDTPNQNSCGGCCRCIKACPTQAIAAPYYIDCNQCITAITTNKKETDFTRIAQYGWLIGCDICQNVCPNNVHAPVNEEAIAMQSAFLNNKEEIFSTLTPDSFEHYFKDTAIYQLKYEGLKQRLDEIQNK
jgi:epoxyqueuosine reductase